MNKKFYDLSNGHAQSFLLESDQFQFKVPVIPKKELPPTMWGRIHNSIWEDCVFAHSIDFETYKKLVAHGLERNFKKTKTTRDKYGVYGKSFYEGYSHVKGVLAEFNYQNWSGEKMDLETYLHGDNGDFAKGLVEIKAAAWCKNLNPTLKFSIDKDWPKTLENKSIVFILCRIKDGFCHGLNYCHSEIIGWTSIERFKILRKEVPKKGHLNWEMNAEDLIHFLPSSQNDLLNLAITDCQIVKDAENFVASKNPHLSEEEKQKTLRIFSKQFQKMGRLTS